MVVNELDNGILLIEEDLLDSLLIEKIVQASEVDVGFFQKLLKLIEDELDL